jgi:hypothetical protein
LLRDVYLAVGLRPLLDCIEWISLGYEIVQSIFPGKFAAAAIVTNTREQRVKNTVGDAGLNPVPASAIATGRYAAGRFDLHFYVKQTLTVGSALQPPTVSQSCLRYRSRSPLVRALVLDLTEQTRILDRQRADCAAKGAAYSRRRDVRRLD